MSPRARSGLCQQQCDGLAQNCTCHSGIESRIRTARSMNRLRPHLDTDAARSRGGPDRRCVFGRGARRDWTNDLVLVVAEFKEWGVGNRSAIPPWLANQTTVFRYQRRYESEPCFCPNRGFESGVYLLFIVQHWHRLPARMAFVQADWFEPRKGVYP